jgi:hypothetical protein
MRRSASTTTSGNPATVAATITVYAFGLEEHTYSYTGSGTSLTNTSNTYYYSLGGRLIGLYNGTSTNLLFTDLLGSVVSSVSNTSGSAAIVGERLYGNQRSMAGSVSKEYTMDQESDKKYQANSEDSDDQEEEINSTAGILYVHIWYVALHIPDSTNKQIKLHSLFIEEYESEDTEVYPLILKSQWS